MAWQTELGTAGDSGSLPQAYARDRPTTRWPLLKAVPKARIFRYPPRTMRMVYLLDPQGYPKNYALFPADSCSEVEKIPGTFEARNRETSRCDSGPYSA